MDQQPHATLTRIGECVLDRTRGILLRCGEIVPVRAKTFALLAHLTDNRGRVISKDELLTTLWPGVIVSEDSLTQCVRDLRKALGDEEQEWLRTVSRRGYILADDTTHAAATAPMIASLPGEAVVAVLPFAVIGDGNSVLIDGVIEEIINGLARFRSVTVIARASAFAFPVVDRPPPQIIGTKLGADHLVEGTFRKTPTGYRVSVTLTHAPTIRQIWGEQFDCAEADLLDIDAVIAQRIIGRLVANIEESALRRSISVPTHSMKAFEHFMRGKMFLRGFDDEANANAIACLRRSVEADPDFALAQAYLALAEVVDADFGAAPRTVLEAARDRMRFALTLAPEESRCHRIMGIVQLCLRAHGAAESYMRHALELNPYDADALAQMGFILTMRGHCEEGLRWQERAVELNPFRPAWYDQVIAYSLYGLERYTEAIEVQERIPDSSVFQEARLAATYAMAGKHAEAAMHIEKALARAGDLDVLDYFRRVTEYEHEGDFLHLREGIVRALDAYRASS